MGLFDFMKRGNIRQCPSCSSKDVSPATPEQTVGTKGEGTPYFCNNCGRIFYINNQ